MKETAERKFKNISLLTDYSKIPSQNFWDDFPRRNLPSKAETRINAKNLEKAVKAVESHLTNCEKKRAAKVISDLKEGADSYQKSSLPPITVQNAKSAITHGAMITDKIATWIHEGYVAGPF